MTSAQYDKRTAEMLEPTGLALPKPDEKFVQLASELFSFQAEDENNRDMSVSDDVWLWRRQMERMQRLFIDSTQLGAAQTVLSDTFLCALKALEFMRDKPFNITPQRETVILQMMERLRKQFELGDPPRPLGDPELLRIAAAELRNSHYMELMANMRSYPRRMMEFGNDLVADLRQSIKDLPEGYRDTAGPVLTRALEQIEAFQQQALSHGYGIVRGAEQHSVDLRKLLPGLADAKVARQLEKTCSELEELSHAPPKPGQPMNQEVIHYLNVLEKLRTVCQGSSDPAARELAAGLAHQRGQIQAAFMNPEASEAHIREYPIVMKELVEKLREDIKQHETHFDAFSSVLTGNWAKYLRGSLQQRLDQIDKKMKFTEHLEFKANEGQLLDEIEFMQLVVGLHRMMHADNPEYTDLDLKQTQQETDAEYQGRMAGRKGAYAQNPEEQLYAMSNVRAILQNINPQGAQRLAGDFRTYDSIAGSITRNTMADAGVRSTHLPWSYSVGLQKWGTPPQGQIAFDRLETAYNSVYQTGHTKEVFARRIAELNMQSQEERWDSARLEQECRRVYDACWDQIEKTRQAVETTVHATVDRALTQGLDDLKPLNDRQLQAFNVILEQEARREEGELARYRLQINQVQIDPVLRPVSDLISKGQREVSLSGLSAEDLEQRARSFGADYEAARAMYSRLSSEISTSGNPDAVPGYQQILAALELVGPLAYRDLQPSFPIAVDTNGIAQLPESELYLITSHWERAFEMLGNDVLRGVLKGGDQWNPAAVQAALKKMFDDHLKANTDHEELPMIKSRRDQFFQKFERLYSAGEPSTT